MYKDFENGANLNIRKPEEIKPVEQVERTVPINEQANFKGNYSELLFSRMQNPVIRKQLLDLLEMNEKWLVEHPIMIMKRVSKEDLPTVGKILNNYQEIPLVYNPKSRKELEDELNEDLEMQKTVTRIDRNKDVSASGVVFYRNSKSDATRQDIEIGTYRPTTDPLTENEIRKRSLIEAHEKGHVFRYLKASTYLRNRFTPAFISPLDVEKHLLQKFPKMSESEAGVIIKYLFDFERPIEIMERMSQLKCYFGMKGDEKFTSQHLQYARDHYLKDVMYDNKMEPFFDAITPQTEFAFLKLINSAGI
ncbi:TPA: hypothetical protein DEP94_01485 [Candidatus Nomurabacteria bacterium]|nr:hypothetical protein [Candidatus Nomurabacteria bacterium]